MRESADTSGMTRRVSLASVTGVAALLIALAGCGGSSAPPAGQALAAKACQSSGTSAATLASQAAAANPRYSTLAVDETAEATSQSGEESELSDGNSSDDNSLGAVAGAESIGTAGGDKVLSDCISLGLSVVHH
jgi:hypothetical protein